MRLEYSEMEFIWRPMYGHLGRKAEMLGHVLYDFWTSPLDLIIKDSKQEYDPSFNHTEHNSTRPEPPNPSPLVNNTLLLR